MINTSEKVGITVWLHAGKVKDWTFSAGEIAENLGEFPMNSPDSMIQDSCQNNTWKNLMDDLYETINKRDPPRQTMRSF